MNPKKLLAVMLALVLILVSTGVLAYAQGLDGIATPSELGETADEAASEALSPETPDAQEEPEEEKPAGEDVSNVVVPGGNADPEDEETDDPADIPAGELTDDPADIPAGELTDDPADEGTDDPTDTPEEPEDDSATVPEEEPTPAPDDDPEEEPEAASSAYAAVRGGTSLYRDRERTDKLGTLKGNTVMLVDEVRVYEGGSLYKAYFDTAETTQEGECAHAYFFASSLERLSREEAEGCLAAAAAHKVDGRPVLMAEIEAEADGDDSAQEEPAEEDPDASCVNQPSVNLRAEPDTKAERLAKLTNGERVEVRARVINAQGEAWYAVTWQGQDGFIRADLVNAVGDVPLMRYDGQALVPMDGADEETEADGEASDAPETDGDLTEETPDAPETDDGLTEETPDATAPEADGDEAQETAGSEEQNPGDVPAEDQPEQPTPKYAITYLNADGSVLAVYEAEAGTIFDEEVFIVVEGEFLGWYPCDETGAWTGDVPYDFGQPIEGAVCVRAKVNAQQNEEAEAERRITVSAASDTAELELGSRITLTAELEGYEGLDYACCWQYAAADRDGNIVGEWQDAQADSLSFGYVLTEENLLTAWRMCVTVNEE